MMSPAFSSILGMALIVILGLLPLMGYARHRSPTWGIVLLLLITLLSAVPGLLIAYSTEPVHLRRFLDATALIFGGMLIGPCLVWIAIHLFSLGERRRFQEERQRKFNARRSLQTKIRDRANLVKMKQCPGFSLLFCVLGTGVGASMLAYGLIKGAQSSAERLAHVPSIERFLLIVMGTLITVCYIWAVFFCLNKIMRNQWSVWLDKYIADLDAEIDHKRRS